MRYICLDTETTGLNVKEGERVFDVGCVEIINRVITDRTLQFYCNPNKALSKASKTICKMEDEFLQDKPLFQSMAQGFLDFLLYDKDKNSNKAVILAHNAKFDVDFLKNELNIAGLSGALDEFHVIDTIKIAKSKFPGTGANLDILCKKFDISLSNRVEQGHGSLHDSVLLAQVFLAMCQDDSDDYILNLDKPDVLFFGFAQHAQHLKDRMIGKASLAELNLHKAFMSKSAQI